MQHGTYTFPKLSTISLAWSMTFLFPALTMEEIAAMYKSIGS